MTIEPRIELLNPSADPDLAGRVSDFLCQHALPINPEQWDQTLENVFRSNFRTYKLISNGEILVAGLVQLDIGDPQETVDARIALIATHPDHRGEGLGRKMMVVLEDVAREAGALTITVAAASNEEVGFFAKQDYTVISEFDDLALIKTLAPEAPKNP